MLSRIMSCKQIRVQIGFVKLKTACESHDLNMDFCGFKQLWVTNSYARKYILAQMSIHIAVYTHCQMNKNPCSSQDFHVLFEHGSELENT